MEENRKTDETQGTDLSAEQVLGLSVASQPTEAAIPHPETDVPTIWKVFGGAIVSIIFMLIVTIFGYIFNNAQNIQNNINTLNAESVKKTELNDRITTIWQTLRQVDVLKDRLDIVEKRLPAFDSMKEKSGATDQRVLMLETQVKTLQEENKTQGRDITALRERLAVVEAAQKK
jgi:hypothetical protein